MSSTPVRSLKVVDPRLQNPVSVNIPWDSFPKSLQKGLDALDTNDDGKIVYSPRAGGATASQAAEVQHSDQTATKLLRVLWGYAWDYPSNKRVADGTSRPDRMINIQRIQQDLYNNVVLALLGKRDNFNNWETAQRVLEETGDFTHLYRLGEVAINDYNRTHNIQYLQHAERLLLSARRYAARVRQGRHNTANNTVDLRDIEASLKRIGSALDSYEKKQFKANVRHPYLLAAPGSPITADLTELQSGQEVFFAVAVPNAFITKHGKNVESAIKDYFNSTQKVFVSGARFKDRRGLIGHHMQAMRVEKDAPGPQDDRIDLQSSFHLYQPRLNRTVFRGHKVTYYRVGFRLTEPSEALGSRPHRLFDIVLEGPKGRRRTVEKAFVLQNMKGRTSHDVFAADLHVTDREYTVVRDMVRSIQRTIARWQQQGLTYSRDYKNLLNAAEEIERYYEPINEHIEAAIDEWNDAYRKGEIDRVFLIGDLADFVNIAVSLDRFGYRSTNVRTLKSILSRAEVPLFTVSGNHDHHGAPFPMSVHRRNFVFNKGLQDYFEDHYDSQHFKGVLLWHGIQALLPGTTGGGGVIQMMRRLNASEPFDIPNDDFMAHHLREIGIYETYGTNLGNGFRVFLWPTESEHFNYSRFLLEEAEQPVGKSVIRAWGIYVGKQHVNGNGPRPENYISFLRELEVAQQRSQRLILGGHYSPFSSGKGPDKTPDTEDALRGDAAWAVRLASWYYRFKNGDPVLALSVAGHVHHYEETDFVLNFGKLVESKKTNAGKPAKEIQRLSREEEGQFRQRLGKILRAKDTTKIFDQLRRLRRKYYLNDIVQIRRVKKPGSNGLPGPIVSSVNKDCKCYGQEKGTAFVNVPSLGVPADSKTGYIVVTTRPDGKYSVATRFLRVRPDASIVSRDGRKLESYRKRYWQDSRDWDSSRNVAAFNAHKQPTKVQIDGPRMPRKESRWDLFPLAYQYPRKKLGLTLDIGLTWDWRKNRAGALLGGEFLIPLTNETHGTLGGPNYLTFGAYWSSLSNDLMLNAGMSFGMLTPLVFVDKVTSKSPFIGGELRLHGILPIPPQLGVWGGSDIHRNWGVGMNLIFVIPALTYRMGRF